MGNQDDTFCADCGTERCLEGCSRYGSPVCRDSLYETGLACLEEGDPILAVGFFERAAHRTCWRAYLELAKCYTEALGVAVDYEKAKEYYKLAQSQRSFYDEKIAEAKCREAYRGVSMVRPLSALTLNELCPNDESLEVRYLETKGSLTSVGCWRDVLVGVVSFLCQCSPDGIYEFVRQDRSNLLKLREMATTGHEQARYEIEFAQWLSDDEAFALCRSLEVQFRDDLAEVKVWGIQKTILISIRETKPSVLKSKAQKAKKHQKPVKKNGKMKQRGAFAKSSSQSSRHEPEACGCEREDYAMKGIGFVVRDKGRYGSLPMYDDMNG